MKLEKDKGAKSCEQALWFADSYGLDLLGVVCRMRNSKQDITLNMRKSLSASGSSEGSSGGSPGSSSGAGWVMRIVDNYIRSFTCLIDLVYQMRYTMRWQ